MSITFVYFQIMDLFTWILILIPAIIQIVLNIMLLWSEREEEGRKKQKIMVNLSIINIVFILLRFAIPGISLSAPSTETDIAIYKIYVLLSGLFGRVPFFITYGIMMYWYGNVNRDLLTKNYLISTRIFLISNGFFLMNFTLVYIFALTSSLYVSIDIQAVLRKFFLLLYLIGWLFLTLHGKTTHNKKFVFAGILGCGMVFFMSLTHALIIDFNLI